MTSTIQKTTAIPAKHQNRQPVLLSELQPQPRGEGAGHHVGEKLKNRAVLITGGDSGIGRAVAIGAAKEGARIAIVYLEEDGDARETKRLVEEAGGELVALRADVGDERQCRHVVDETVRAFGRLDVLVNDAGEEHPQERPEDMTAAQIEKTFRANVFSQFFMASAALPHMKSGASIVNLASIAAYDGHPQPIDDASTNGAIVSFTRALSISIVDRGIRVNAVAPGPLKRPGHSEEVAAAVVFLACDDASSISGQTLHVNGAAAEG